VHLHVLSPVLALQHVRVHACQLVVLHVHLLRYLLLLACHLVLLTRQLKLLLLVEVTVSPCCCPGAATSCCCIGHTLGNATGS
jgi:hypothetical protein